MLRDAVAEQDKLIHRERERRLEDDFETDIVPSRDDVLEDFDQARQHYTIGRFGAKWVKRKYAFGEPDVPNEETLWMKVVYPFSGKPSV